eukprot:1245664-Amphidinium_carterae.1
MEDEHDKDGDNFHKMDCQGLESTSAWDQPQNLPKMEVKIAPSIVNVHALAPAVLSYVKVRLKLVRTLCWDNPQNPPK